ncbi:unnamed protein product [Ophioblennius macclurei]
MEDGLKCLSINWMVIFCVLNVFLPAEGNLISVPVGSLVNLSCSNEPISDFVQLTWKKNGDPLLSYRVGDLHLTEEAVALDLNILTSTLERYALIINRAWKNHTGNYSCEMTSKTAGVTKEHWALVVTDKEEKTISVLVILVGAIIAVVCLVVFVFARICLGRKCKKDEGFDGNSRRQTQQTEDIYENCLEIEQRHNKQPHYYKTH